MIRPDWHTYFIEMAKLAATRSTCCRRQHGAILVRKNRILATGYNGQPPGLFHCEKHTCLRKKLKIPSGERYEICRAVHAEQNAFLQAAKDGINITGADIYITGIPCPICIKLIISLGIHAIYVDNVQFPYPLTMDLIAEAGIPIWQIKTLKDGTCVRIGKDSWK